MRIADKSTCSADGFGWLEACTNLIILMMVMVTLIVMMAIYVTVMLTLMTLVLTITSRAASQEDLGRRGGGQ